MIYIVLAVIVFVILVFVVSMPKIEITGCQGNCNQGRWPCDCQRSKQPPTKD